MKNHLVLLLGPDGTHQFNSIEGVELAGLPFVVVLEPAQWPSFRKVLDRAMNCWEPQDQPAWLQGMSDELDRRIAEE
jgi:hypothetical protein